MDGIKQRIKDLRKKHGLTMAEFSARIHVSPGNVGDWESEKRSSTPGTKALIAIAEEFQISLDWLILGRGSAEPSELSETGQCGSEGEAGAGSVTEKVAHVEQEWPYTSYQNLMSIASTLSTSDVDLLSQVANRFKSSTKELL